MLPMADGAPNPTVLVVEDNPLNMKLTTDLLQLNGFTVLQAADGETALELANTHRPALVLLDIHLPGMDGVEVFQKLKAGAGHQGIKIVALTASAMREEEERIRAMGFDQFIAKPINTRQFIPTIRQVLGT